MGKRKLGGEGGKGSSGRGKGNGDRQTDKELFPLLWGKGACTAMGLSSAVQAA